METLPDLRVNLTLNAQGFDVTASKAGSVLRSLSKNFDDSAVSARKVEGAMGRVSGSFKDTVVTLGALRFALMDVDAFLLKIPKSVAATGGEFQKLETLMAGLSKSTDEATQKLEGLRDVASIIQISKNAPFDVKSLADSFVKLKSAGIDPAAGSMQALVGSVAKFGGSSEQLKRASVAIQQMFGKGVVSMEELRQQLGESIPNAMDLMAKGMGMSVAELTKQVSKGVVQTRTAVARMFAQMQIDSIGAAERLMMTMPGALSKLQTEIQLFQKTMSDQGFLTTITEQMNRISAFLSSDEGNQLAKSLGQSLQSITEGFISMAEWVAENTKLLKMLGTALLAAYGGSKLAGAFQGIRGRMEETRAAQKAVADEAASQNLKQIKDIEKKNDAIAKQIKAIESAGDAERKSLEASSKARVDALRDQNKYMAKAIGSDLKDQDKTKLNSIADRTKEIKDLTRTSATLEGQMKRAESALESNKLAQSARIGKDLEGFNKYKGASLDGLRQIEQEQRASLEKQLAALKEFKAKEAAALAAKPASYASQAPTVGAPTKFAQKPSYMPSNGDISASMYADRIKNMTAETNAQRAAILETRNAIKATAELTLAKTGERMNATLNLAQLEADVQKSREAVLANKQKIATLTELNATESSAKRVIGENVQARTAQIKANNAQIAALRADTSAHQENISQVSRATASLREHMTQNEALIASKRTLTSVATGAGNAVVGFGLSMLKGLGWTIAFTVAVEGAIYLYEMLTKSARDAEAQVLRTSRAQKGQSVEGDSKATGELMRSKQKELEALQNEIAVSEKARAGFKGTKGESVFENDLKNQQAAANKLRTELNALNGTLLQSQKLETDTKVTNDSQSMLNRIQKNADKLMSTSDLKNKANANDAAMEKAVADKNVAQIAILRKAREALGAEQSELAVKFYKQASEEEIALQKTSDKATVDALKTGAADKLAALVKQRADVLDPNLTGPAKPEKPKGGINGIGPSSYDTMIAGLNKDLVELKSRAETYADGTKSVADIMRNAEAQLQAAIDGGLTQTNKKTGKNEKLTAAEKAKAIGMIYDKDFASEVDKARTALLPLLAQITADQEKWNEAFSGKTVDKDSKGQKSVDKLIAKFAPMREILEKDVIAMGMTWDQFIQKLKVGADMSKLGEDTQKWREEAEQLEASAEVDDRDRQIRITAVRKKAIDERLAADINAIRLAGAATAEQEAQMKVATATADRLKAAEDAALARRNETSIDALVRDWQDGSRKLQDLGAQTADAWVDAMAEGTFNIKDQIKAVGTDLLKLTMKENLSGSIKGILDDTTSAVGGFLGIGGAKASAAKVASYDASGAQYVRVVNGDSGAGMDMRDPQGDGKTGVESLVEKGKVGFTDLFEKAKTGFGDLTSGIGSGFSSIFSGLGSTLSNLMGSMGGAGSGLASVGSSIMSMFGFANGGIMTGMGAASLKKYANGGVANKPQLAMFGEGSTPEAYVPLPDGRTIPVTLAGATSGGGGSPEAPDVTVNVINQTGKEAQATTSSRFDGKQMVLDIVLTAINQPGSFREGMKNAVN